MFSNLEETIRNLNADVSNVANCEKAKKLKKKLLAIGLPLAICGFLGAFTCFVLFATAGFAAFGDNGFTARVLVPFILIIPFFIIGSIGLMISSMGLRITVTGYTANLINETVGNNCPSCSNTVSEESLFCTNCGAKLKKICEKCNHTNSYKNNFCEKCGNSLD